jgi:ribonuclease D
MKQLKDMAVLSDNQLNMHGKALINIIGAAMSLPRDQLPRYPYTTARFPDVLVTQKIKKLKMWRQHKAESLKMDAGMLMNNSVLKIVVEKKPKSIDDLYTIPEMKNWQKKEFGKEIINVLTGRS